MKKIAKSSIIVILFAIVFMIIIEDFSIINLLIGLVVSAAAIFITNKFMLDASYQSFFDFNIAGFVLYMGYLLYRIIISGVYAAYLTIYGRTKLVTIEYSSQISSAFGLTLLANSITMTPGTATVSMVDNKLLILQMCKQDNPQNIEDISALEKCILKFVTR